jgi:hypothetical protein
MRLPLVVKVEHAAEAGNLQTLSEDVSSRGVYFYLPKEVKKGADVEILMTLPHEITQAGPVKVRCMGRIHRTERRGEQKIGVVAAIERYEFLRDEAGAGRL